MEVLEDIEDCALICSLRDRIAQGPVASGALAWENVADSFARGESST